MEDCYKVLGVKRGATLAEIRRAYRKRVKELHPDASGNPETSGEFRRVVRAYEILSDAQSRKIFDSSADEIFRRKKRKSWDYREWLLEREDDESRAKLVIFDLMHGKEGEAVREYKRLRTERARFSLRHWFTKEEFMDFGFILSEELSLRREYYDAAMLLCQIIELERKYEYFRLFFSEVMDFFRNIMRNHIDGKISDELALDFFESALELRLGKADDAFILRKMGGIYARIGDGRTSKICYDEADRILVNSELRRGMAI